MKKGRIALCIVGFFSIILALQGFWYNLTSLSVALKGGFSSVSDKVNAPYLYPAFYTMSFISIVCYIILLFSGFEFIRVNTGMLKIFIAILIFEVIYFFSVGACWLLPNYGMSIGAATGIANGGMVVQELLLFPLWAPFLAVWANKRLEDQT